MPVGSKSIRSIVHHGRREHDEEVGIGNCGRSSLINQARDLADRFAADGRDEAQADAMLDETWQVAVVVDVQVCRQVERSEEHTSELQSLMRISYAVFCLKKKKN